MKQTLNELDDKIQKIETILTKPLIKHSDLFFDDILKIVDQLNEAKELINLLVLEDELYG